MGRTCNRKSTCTLLPIGSQLGVEKSVFSLPSTEHPPAEVGILLAHTSLFSDADTIGGLGLVDERAQGFKLPLRLPAAGARPRLRRGGRVRAGRGWWRGCFGRDLSGDPRTVRGLETHAIVKQRLVSAEVAVTQVAYKLVFLDGGEPLARVGAVCARRTGSLPPLLRIGAECKAPAGRDKCSHGESPASFYRVARCITQGLRKELLTSNILKFRRLKYPSHSAVSSSTWLVRGLASGSLSSTPTFIR